MRKINWNIKGDGKWQTRIYLQILTTFQAITLNFFLEKMLKIVLRTKGRKGTNTYAYLTPSQQSTENDILFYYEELLQNMIKPSCILKCHWRNTKPINLFHLNNSLSCSILRFFFSLFGEFTYSFKIFIPNSIYTAKKKMTTKKPTVNVTAFYSTWGRKGSQTWKPIYNLGHQRKYSNWILKRCLQKIGLSIW